MLIQKVIDFAKKCSGTIEEIKTEVKTFVGEEVITNEEGETVDFNSITFSEKEAKEYQIDLEIKKAVEEVKKEQKEVNKIESKAIECETFEVPAYSGTLKAFKTPEDAYSSGMHFKAHLMGDVVAKQWCADNIKTAQNVTTDAQGGYLTTSELSSAVESVLLQYGVVRKVVTPQTMNELILYIDRATQGLTAYCVAELSATTESNMGWELLTLTAKEISVLCLVTNLLASNSVINLAEHIAVESGRAIALWEDTAVFTGAGAAGSAGITGLQDQLELVSAATVTAQGVGYDWSDITLSHFAEVVALVPAQYRQNAAWFCSRAFKGASIDPLMYSLGGNAIADIKGGTGDDKFMNFPVYLSEVLPSTMVDEDVACIFGSLSDAVYIGDREGISMSESNSHNDAFSKRQKYYRVDRSSGYNVPVARENGPIAGLIVDSTS